MKQISLILLAIGSLAACAPKNQAVSNIASQTLQDIACKEKTLEINFFDNLKSYIIKNNAIPPTNELKKAFTKELEMIQSNHPDLSKSELNNVSAHFYKLIDTILETAPLAEKSQTAQEVLVLISGIDAGDRSTEAKTQAQDAVLNEFRNLKNTVRGLAASCSSFSTTPRADQPGEGNKTAATNFETHRQHAINSGVPLSVLGAKWTFATAYQSCQNLVLPPITSQTPQLSGIKITGKHRDGIGSKREIASLSEVQSSHYYINGVNNYESGCFNVRQFPLIYDYGGKPYVTTASNSPLNLFKNGGDGTSVLGIDCSGYVFSAMASAGLKMQANRPLKASDALAWGSTSYLEPQKNGLTCLDKISISTNSIIKGGDIVAVQGHMLMIESVGTDPFGITSVGSEKDCSKITSNNFNFIIIQSSNSKNGIGINRYEARDYLSTSPKMKLGLEKYAYYACMTKFSHQTVTPNLGTISIVRHNGKPECMAPRVSLSNESCIQSCPILN